MRDYVVYRLKDLVQNPLQGNYHTKHLLQMHHVLASMRAKKWKYMEQSEQAKEFSASLADLWRIHPFREGNTRTTITFCCQFADEMGFPMNRYEI